jgi:peroxiredoxin
VSVDPPEDSERLRRRLECGFTFLSDPEGAALDRLNIRHRGGRHDGADIAFPAQVLVDEGGIVRWTYQTDSIRRRARPEAIFAAIDSMRR